MDNLDSTFLIGIFIYLGFQTLLSLIARILLVIGSVMVLRKVAKWYGWCLLVGSILLTISYLPSAPVFSVVLTRTLSIKQYAQISGVLGLFYNLALLIFGSGFIGLSRQFYRNHSHR